MRQNVKSANATDVKNRFGDFLGTVIRKREPLVIERHGKPVAVLVRYEEWAGKRKGPEKKTPWVDSCERLAQDIARTHPSRSFSAVDLVRAIREEEPT